MSHTTLIVSRSEITTDRELGFDFLQLHRGTRELRAFALSRLSVGLETMLRDVQQAIP